MGPITLFDKSFLQSLSVDESVWFDHFFLTNVCPLFYVETLADLEKSVREGRTPEDEVRVIADKFPDMHGSPSVYHTTACIADLLGEEVPMTGQIPLARGRPVKAGGKTGWVVESSREAEAFSRWQNRQFLEVERRSAQAWRAALSPADPEEVARALEVSAIHAESCKSLEAAKAMAEAVVSSPGDPCRPMAMALALLRVPPEYHNRIIQGWETANRPQLTEYAPYAAYALTVELFSQITLAARLISSQRPSSRVDIAYLFYLPFCMVFVSSDRLHRRCAPLFLRDDQQFVWGQDLKEALRELNDHYSGLPASTKATGVMSFARYPPDQAASLVRQLWDRHLPGWRDAQERSRSATPLTDSELVEKAKRMADAPALAPDQVDFDVPDAFTVQRRVRRRKGSWYQVPKDLLDPED